MLFSWKVVRKMCFKLFICIENLVNIINILCNDENFLLFRLVIFGVLNIVYYFRLLGIYEWRLWFVLKDVNSLLVGNCKVDVLVDKMWWEKGLYDSLERI